MRIFVLGLLVTLAFQVFAAAQENSWNLRNRLRFASPSATLEYAEDQGAWRVLTRSGAVMAESEGFSATLEDGHTLRSAELTATGMRREAYSGPLGEGTHYVLAFAAHAGLVFEHRVTLVEGRPFVVMSLSVRNLRETPVPLQQLAVASFLNTGAVSLGQGGQYESAPVALRGGAAVLSGELPALMARFSEEAAGVCLTMGVASAQAGMGGVQFSPDRTASAGHRWRGRVATDFSAERRLMPGETIRAEDVVVVYGLPDVAGSETNFFWAAGTLMETPTSMSPPLRWITHDTSGDFETFLKATGKWGGGRVKNALIPGGWARSPGVLQGDAPRYPRNIGNAADALRKRGYAPGITINPLAVKASDKPWIYTSPSGEAWLNPKDETAQSFLQERVRGLAALGFKFFVVEAETISDAALAQFGLGRNEATRLALAGVRQAVPTSPVYLSPGETMTNVSLPTDARSAIAQLAAYGVPASPVQIDLSGITALGPVAVGALQNWPGPLSFSGTPTQKVRRELADVLRQGKEAGVR